MMNTIKPSQTQTGFTLIEMAVVLAIVALLLAGLLPTVSSQIEQSRRNESRKQINEIQQALLGFAIISGRLPCPTTTQNPADVLYGLEDLACNSDPTTEGYLPWKTLGVSETDAWGSKRSSAGDAWLGYWHYRVDRNFAAAFNLNTGFSSDKLSVNDNMGNLITASPSGCSGAAPKECPIAIVFSTGPNLRGDGQNTVPNTEVPGIFQSDVPGGDFDDILVWISRPQLFNRMVTAGKLP
ncbi:MAG: type II secretion system protein [Sulfuriferula sp.]